MLVIMGFARNIEDEISRVDVYSKEITLYTFSENLMMVTKIRIVFCFLERCLNGRDVVGNFFTSSDAGY
mgnify:CR=1 FL=1|tara:strand:- start:500 stop:706 length:207 start_codon:yes stop_codon:yes gene_type:complete